MLAELTSKNQISLPAAIVRELPETKYFSFRWKADALS